MNIAGWAVLFAAALAVFSTIKYFLMKRIRSKAVCVIADLLLAVATLFLGLGIIAFASKLLWKLSRPLCALYIVLLCDAICNCAYGIIRLIKPVRHSIENNREKWRKGRVLALVLTAVLMFAYGTVNMERVVCEDITYSSEKLENDYDFAFFADVHAGRAQPMKVLAGAIDEIEGLNPDFVVIGGDMTDEYTSKEDMQEAYRIVGGLTMPVYFVYGNHDRQAEADAMANGRQFTEDELREAILSNGIIILEDESVQIAPDLLLIGREDGGREDIDEENVVHHRKKALAELVPATESYIVTVEHQPYALAEAAAAGVDLLLSGHTHAAQLFPLQAVYNLAGIPAYGEFTEGDSVLYVSAGLSGWCYPFRTEEHSAYNMVHLRAG